MQGSTRPRASWLAMVAVTALALAGAAACAEEVPDPPAPTSPGGPPSGPPPEDAIASLQERVVSVELDGSQISGVVVSAEGHVLTLATGGNGSPDQPVTVTLHSGDSGPGEVVATDARSQLAVVRTDVATGLAPAVFGDSDAVEVGDEIRLLSGPVAAAPDPVSSGTVEATDQLVGAVIMIATDAAAHPGSGGGPLVNSAGEVIGVHAAATSGAEDSGVSLAVPANLAAQVAEQLIADGRVAHPYLGVSVDDAPDGGALVGDVAAGSPAERAGLRPGDVITAIGDRRVESAQDVVAGVQSAAVGDELTVGYRRDGTEAETTATLEAAPAQ